MICSMFIVMGPHEEQPLFSAVSSLILLFVNYVVFEVYDWVGRDMELQALNRLYEQQLNLCNLQAEERERSYLEIRRMRHDMKNHLFSLLGMVNAGQETEAAAYIHTMLNDGIGDRADEVSRSGNIVVDSLVNYKYALAQKEGIFFEANVLVPPALPFLAGHITIILGNLLENAIEACVKMQYITVLGYLPWNRRWTVIMVR